MSVVCVLRVQVCLFFLFLSSVAYSDSDRFLVGIIEDGQPYMWKDNGHAMGPDADFIREIGRRLDIEFKIKAMPLKRVLHGLEHGEVDFGVGFKTKERAEFAEFIGPTPLHWSDYRVYVNKNNRFPFSQIEDLYGKKVARNRGFAISVEYDEAAREGKIRDFEVNHFTSLVDVLRLGRVDAIVGNRYGINRVLRQRDDIVSLGPISPLKGSYLMLSKKSKISDRDKLVRRIAAVAKEIVDDGTINKIEDKYPEYTYIPEDRKAID